MKRRLAVTAALLSSLVLATPVHAEKMEMGTLLGAGLGGLLGSQFGKGEGKLVTTGLGVFLGGVLGNSAGSSLDRGDEAYYNGGSRRTGYQDITWHEERNYYRGNGHAYGHRRHHRPYVVERTVVVQQPVVYEPVVQEIAYQPQREERGGYCREYQHSVHIGSRVQESYGTACLQPDGSWKVVD